MGGDGFGNGNGKANLHRVPVGHDVWGRMCHYRGVVTHHLSPFEQRVFAGWISKGAPNMVRRIRGQLFKIGIPFTIGILIFNWANTYHAKLIRKDPKFFENEYNEYLMSDEHKVYLQNKLQEQEEAERNVKKGK